MLSLCCSSFMFTNVYRKYLSELVCSEEDKEGFEEEEVASYDTPS